MISRADIQSALHKQLKLWFKKQCENPLVAYHLYYTESKPGSEASFAISTEKPSLNHKIAMPEQISACQTVEQNFNRIVLSGRLDRLPLLDT